MVTVDRPEIVTTHIILKALARSGLRLDPAIL
jgi:hypothetical protein